MPAPYTYNRQYTWPSAADAVAVTPNAGTWTDSAWFELVAAADASAIVTGLIVQPDDALGAFAATSFEIDLGIGAAGAEAVVATFRGHYGDAADCGPGRLPAPIGLDVVPNGVRVAVRIRIGAHSTNNAWRVAATYLAKPIRGSLLTTSRRQQCYPSAADNIVCTLGAGAWANSSWVEVVAATLSGIVVVSLVIETTFVTTTGTHWEFDLGVGGSGSEVPIATVRTCDVIGTTDGPRVIPLFTPLDAVPAGSRLAVRTRASTVTSRHAGFALNYIPKPL
jgi:hypothetical protein